MSSLHIELTKPEGRPFYRPGDLVTGVVHVNISYDTAHAQRIEVAFSGRSEIDCVRTYGETFRIFSPWQGSGRTIFFDQTQSVCTYDEHHLPALGASQWPFSFVFPAESSSTQLSRVTWQTSATSTTFPSGPGITLPPSWGEVITNWPATSGSASESPYDGEINGQVSILYELEARLVGGQGTYLRHATCPLPFVPYSRNAPTKPIFYKQDHTFKCESRQLLGKSDKFSLRSSVKSRLSKAPISTFKLVTDIPTSSTADEPLRLYLGIEYDFESSTAAEIPPVMLRELEIEYLEYVTLGFRNAVYSTDPVVTVKSLGKRRYITFPFKKANMIQVVEQMALHEVLPRDKLFVDELTFETPNIQRSYKGFSVTVTVVCAGKQFIATSRIRGQDFLFLPSPPPPNGIELQDSRRLPPEADSEAVHMLPEGRTVYELQGEAAHELEDTVGSPQVPRTSIYELSAPV